MTIEDVIIQNINDVINAESIFIQNIVGDISLPEPERTSKITIDVFVYQAQIQQIIANLITQIEILILMAGSA